MAAALTLPFGITSSKEYAELEWPIDLMITITWLSWGINMIGTMMNRRERHLYVAMWFFLSTFLGVALLHVVNSLAMPVSMWKSYSLFAGGQDALVQWWYGHNAVAFFLTTPILGLMYYFLPKAANRPVFLPFVDYSFLVIGLYLYLGRSAPPAAHFTARMGTKFRHRVFYRPVGTVVGRHGQRHADDARRLGQIAYRTRITIFLLGVGFLWYVNI